MSHISKSNVLTILYSQVVFPLDYIIYCGMILFFLLCSISGLRTIGITFCCVPVYRFRPSNTKPQVGRRLFRVNRIKRLR